jgi:hypothetical protein
MKKALRQLILSYLLIVVVIEVSAYVVTKFGYMSGAMSKFVSESSFYAMALFMPLLFGWIFFGGSYVLVRKCRNCGSKNIRLAFPRTGFVCEYCDHVFEPSLQKNTKILIPLIVIPFLFLGPCLSLGAILAGETTLINIVRNGVLFSAWFPSFIAIMLYSCKLMDKSPFFYKKTVLVFTVLFILLFVCVLMLFILDYIIAQILERIM